MARAVFRFLEGSQKNEILKKVLNYQCPLGILAMFGSDRTSELYMTDLHPRLWSRVVTGHQLFGTRFSESLNTVKDVAEESISKDYSSLISDTEKSVKKDMNHEFSSYGHTMWDLNK